MAERTGDRVNLGEVTAPSGILVITDMGYLGSWSGSEPPMHVPDQVTDPALRESIAAAQDFGLVGPDAQAAARAIDLHSLTFVYDIPRHGVPSIVARFEAAIQEHRFRARLEPESSRVPHRERARRAAAAGGADFTIDGVWSVAIGGHPTDRPLRVTGWRKDYGDGVGLRWSDIEIGGDGGQTAAEQVGPLGVDWARIIVVDADALQSWVHERSLDGLADVAYWGRDEGQARMMFGGEELEDGTIGWADLAEADALERAIKIERWRQEPDRRLIVDFRPHSHHHRLMQQIRRGDEFGVGTIEVGGAQAVAFHTSWGDGVFRVYRHGSAERPQGMRIELGDDQRAQRTRELLVRPGR